MIAGDMTASCFTSLSPDYRNGAPRLAGCKRMPGTNLDGRTVNRPGKDALDTVEDLLVDIILVGRCR
jgi:hypothetical protein